MKLKKIIGALALIGASAASINAASAATFISDPVTGSSFTNLYLGTINLTGLSNVDGSIFAAKSITFDQFPFPFSLQAVTFTSASVGSLVGDLDPSVAGYSFKNVAAGNYTVTASGTLSGFAAIPGLAVIGNSYNVTAVPEPESYAMFLAGLGIMGAVARRRASKQA